MEGSPSLADLARWLHQRLRHPSPEFEAGKSRLRSAVVAYLDCSLDEAEYLLLALEREGYLRYAAEGRSIGTPGYWIVYPSPKPRDGAHALF